VLGINYSQKLTRDLALLNYYVDFLCLWYFYACLDELDHKDLKIFTDLKRPCKALFMPFNRKQTTNETIFYPTILVCARTL